MFEWLHFVNIIVILLIIAMVFIEQKKPVSILSWIVIMLIQPIAGVIIYALVGGLGFATRRSIRKKVLFGAPFATSINDQIKELYEGDFRFKDPDAAGYKDFILMNLIGNRSFYTDDNSLEIITDGNRKFELLFDDIKNAKSSIHLCYYIIKKDELSQKLIGLLIEKAREGIDVKLMYDAFGSAFTPKRYFKKLIKAGGKVTLFFPSVIGINWLNLKLNYRNHRKIAVIDGKVGYTGGINIGTEYINQHKRLSPWRDTHMRLTGSAVYMLQRIFLSDWRFAAKEKLTAEHYITNELFPPDIGSGNVGIQVIDCGPDLDDQEIKFAMIKMIQSAKQSIYIQTPYFVPDESFLDALHIAALSGVDVRVMIPEIPDKHYVYWATLSYVGKLLDFGARVYLYKGFLHAKTVVVDGKVATMGTANIDIRSFELDFEVNLITYDSQKSYECVQIFEEDIKACRLIDRKWYDSQPIPRRALQAAFRLLSPLL